MNQHVPPPVATTFAVELLTCDGQRVMVPLYRLVEAHVRLTLRRRDRIDLIQNLCAEHFRLTQDALCSDRREGEVVHARHIAMYLARHMTEVSTTKIGRRFGNRDHSSITHAVRKVERLIDLDASVRRDVEFLKAAISEVEQS